MRLISILVENIRRFSLLTVKKQIKIFIFTLKNGNKVIEFVKG